jgi:hypothetical protein
METSLKSPIRNFQINGNHEYYDIESLRMASLMIGKICELRYGIKLRSARIMSLHYDSPMVVSVLDIDTPSCSKLLRKKRT